MGDWIGQCWRPQLFCDSVIHALTLIFVYVFSIHMVQILAIFNLIIIDFT